MVLTSTHALHVSLSCFKVLPRLSCDLKIKPKVLHVTYKALCELAMTRPASPPPSCSWLSVLLPYTTTTTSSSLPWLDGTHLSLAHALSSVWNTLIAPPPLTSSPPSRFHLRHPAPSPHSTRQPCSTPLGPQGSGSVAPPELLYKSALDRAICLVSFGGPDGNHKHSPEPPLPLPKWPQLYCGCFSHLRPIGAWYRLAHSGAY